MRICMIVEGNYPYITGGVSSWIQMLITNMQEHEFIIYSIAAEEKNRGKFVYEIPKNVVSIKELFLDSILNLKGHCGKRYRLSKEETYNLVALIIGDEINWKSFFQTIKKRKIDNIIDFFMSYDFFNIIKIAYKNEHSSTPFTEFFWNVRAMLLPLFFIVKQDIVEADLFHSVAAGYAGAVGSLASSFYGKPYILTEHGIYFREREEEIIKSDWTRDYFKSNWINFFKNLSKLSYDNADKVIALFQKNQDIQIDLGSDSKKIQIIPNGINVADFEGIGNKEREESYINIGAVVRVVPIKDIITMIKSFELVKRKIQHAKFYIMGPTDENEEYFKECKQFAEGLGIEDLIFTGRIDIKDYLGEMDILVLTSISEGQTLAILEGMACKKPFVTTDVGSCKELIYGIDDSYGKAGFVVPVMNQDEIAKSIIKLVIDKKSRKVMGLNGYNRVSAIYTIDKFLNGYRDIYNEYNWKIQNEKKGH